MDYVKLKDLVDSTFTVNEAYGYDWLKWDAESKRMLKSDKWEQGFSKVYQLVTDKGKLSVRQGQLAQMLEATYVKGLSNIVGVTFEVKSNGKEGMDIRYYINKTREQKPSEVESPDEVSIDDIPF